MGRKSKYNEPTKVIGFKVPVSRAEEIKPLVDEFIFNHFANPISTIAEKLGNVDIVNKKIQKRFSKILKSELEKSDIKIIEKYEVKQCGCQLLGQSPTGADIWKRCKEHKV